jgi:hypothetical protein
MAAKTPTVDRIKTNIPGYLPEQQIIEINKANSGLAFKTDDTGHLGITEEALNDIEKLVEGEKLKFTRKAIDEIKTANEDTDGGIHNPILFAYKQLGETENHFDDENLEGGSQRLIDLKKQVTQKLQQSPPDGVGARKDLGGALHTLQDFYSHSNWVELGNTGIKTDLGRKPILNPTPNFAPCPNDAAKLEGQGLQILTTGYFKVTSTPKGKCRHGFAKEGINKDTEKSPHYSKARYLAIQATKDYIRQIIDEKPEISQNVKAIKALMGIEEDKQEPCHGEEQNQNKSQNKQTKNESNVCPSPTGTGGSKGDPHIDTFDGFRYSFQTVGEFIATQSKDRKFQVQTRQAPVNKNLSMNSAVAMKVGKDKVAFYSKDFPDADTSTPVRVNGKPTVIQGNKLTLPGGGAILKSGYTYTVDFPTGEKVLVASASAGGNPYFNIQPFVYNQANLYEGLLGNVNGNPNDELQVRGGQNLSVTQSTYGDVKQLLSGTIGLRLPGQLDVAEKLYFDQVNKEFGNSWRVKPEESLFDYPSGKTTKDYTDKSFPEKYLKLDMLSSQELEKARKECAERKISDDLMEACVFDVGFSGFSEFAYTTAQINDYVDIVNKVIPGVNIPKIPKTTELADTVLRKILESRPKVCLPFVGCV